MMNNFKRKLIYFYPGFFSLLLFGIVACTHESDINPEDSTNEGELSAQVASREALALFPGAVREIEIEVEEGVRTWKVDIVAESGAEVEIYYRASDGALFRIDGESGPFTYNIEPGNGWVGFATAKASADSKVAGSLEKWRLHQDDSYGNQWVYTLDYGDTEVVIQASDGIVLEVKS